MTENVSVKAPELLPATASIGAVSGAAGDAEPLAYRLTFPTGVAPDYHKLQHKVLSLIAASSSSSSSTSAAADEKNGSAKPAAAASTSTAAAAAAPAAAAAAAKPKAAADSKSAAVDVSTLNVSAQPFQRPLRGAHVSRRNTVRFTPVQVRSLRCSESVCTLIFVRVSI